MDIRPVSITEIETGAQDLTRHHYLEVEPEPRPPLDIDWQRLLRLEMAGNLLCLAAYDGDAIVGYAVSVIAPHPHFAGTLMCQNDALFVTSSRRGRGLGRRLIQETHAIAKERGATRILWHAAEGSALSALLASAGYAPKSVNWSREI